MNIETISENIFDDLILSHSEFQIKNFILGAENGLTVWSKYKQCLRELYKRIHSLRDINYQIEKKEIEIERLSRKEVTDDLDIREKNLDLAYLKQHLKIILESKKDLIREGNIFLDSYASLKEQVEELLKNHTKDDLERNYWMVKLKNDLDCVGSNIPTGLLQLLQGMEDKKLLIGSSL